MSFWGMNLSHGGHLNPWGNPLNFSGRMYKFVAYGVKKRRRTHRLRRN